MENIYLLFGILFSFFVLGNGLVCFTCANEEWNWGHCITQTQQCQPFQDACTSYTKWTVPRTWAPRFDRITQIYKGCDTRLACQQRQAAVLPTCRPSPYTEWACVECCIGDLCNYYINWNTITLQYNSASKIADQKLIRNVFSVVTAILLLFFHRLS